MAENLKTTKYNDEGSNSKYTVNTEWIALTSDAFCWAQNNEATFKPLYGALYNMVRCLKQASFARQDGMCPQTVSMRSLKSALA
jgi:hypothetical protein